MKKIILTLVVIIALASCAKDDDNSSSINPEPINGVYIGGWEKIGNKNVATIWKNNIPQNLSVESQFTEVKKIFVTNTDVYALVRDGSDYKIYKNGKFQYTLINCDETSDIFVSGSDVYVCGKKGIVAKYWKNNTEVILSQIANPADAMDIEVVNNDVYVAGAESLEGIKTATVWKNNTTYKNYSGLQQFDAFANKISISGSDIYVSSYEYPKYKIWKNLDLNPIYTGGSSEYIDFLKVINLDVYAISRRNNVPNRIYKNGTFTDFPAGLTSLITDIFVYNSEVYAVFGTEDKSITFYKNGVVSQIILSANNKRANTIFIK